MYLLLYSNIVITKGSKRSLILDLQRETFFLIPNSFADFILNCNKRDRSHIYSIYKEADSVTEYLRWLQDHKMITWIENKEALDYFPELSTQWEMPFPVTNIIIDNGSIPHPWKRITDQINELLIPIVQLRFFEEITLEALSEILDFMEDSVVKGIEIIIPYSKKITEPAIAKLLSRFLRIYNIIIFSSPHTKLCSDIMAHGQATVAYIETNELNHQYCGLIKEYQFRANTKLYTEGLVHNTCLNRKIAIDVNGEIKNCPSMRESFGNTRDTTLEGALSKQGFKKYWNITKNQIDKCKGCEFRNVCTDCRAYIENPEDAYAAPLKCGYDPGTCTWEEWSTNPLKQKAIDYYNLCETVPSPGSGT